MKQIVCLADTPWSDVPGREQRLMSLLPKHRILYFDPPPASEHTGVKAFTYRDEGRQPMKGVTQLALPPSPAPGFMQRFGRRKTARVIRNRMDEVAFSSPVLWLTDPSQSWLIGELDHSAVVFDCIGPADGALDLARSSTVVFCRSAAQRGALSQVNPNTFLLQDGALFELFHQAAREDLPFPDGLFNVQGPILGLAGRLSPSSELGFVEAAAKAHPEWSFVFLGPKSGNADLSPVEGLKNVRFLEQIAFTVSPVYIRQFNVCLYLSGSGEYPATLFDLLSTGKPIVSTPQAEPALQYADVVQLAGTKEEFIECCRRAIAEHDAWRVKQRLAYGRAASWEARALEAERFLQEKGVF